MKHAPTIFLALAAAAGLLVPVLAPRDCGAQEKPPVRPQLDPPPAAVVERLHDIGGARTPGARFTGTVAIDRVRPFGFANSNREVADVEPQEPLPGTSQLIEMLRSLLPGGVAEQTDITEAGDGIRVHSTADGQRRVEQALDALRRSAGTPYELDVRSVTLDGDAPADALLAEIDAAPGGTVPDELVRRVLAADRDGGVRGATVAAHDGRWTAVESVRSRQVVTDWDVEIAQAASIADPIPQQIEDGLRAAIRAGRLHDGRALVSVAAATADVVEPFRRVELRTKDLGASEMPEVRGGWATSAAAMREGDTVAFVLASPVSERAAVRRVVFVRLVSAPPAPDVAATTIVPSGAFTTSWANAVLHVPGNERPNAEAFRWGLELQVEGSEGIGGDVLVDMVKQESVPAAEREGNIIAHVGEWPGGGAIVVQGEQAWRDAARATMARLERDRVRAARLSVRLVARGRGGDRTLGMLSAPTVLGRSVAMAAYTSVPFVGDYDVEVAQEARIADPILMAAVGGSVLNIKLSQGPGAALRADLELIATSVGEVESAAAGAAEVGVIERVPVRRARAAQGVLVEPGRAKEIELGANPWGAGRLVAVIRAERVGEK